MRLATLALLLLLTVTSQAQTPSQAIEQTLQLNRQALSAQQQIDRLYEQRRQATEELNLVKQTGSAGALQQQQLQQQLSLLRDGLTAVEDQIAAVNETQTGLLRLLTAMVGALEQFVALDLPFDQDQRRARLVDLRVALRSASLSVTEKYQAVVAAYLDEIRLGSTNAVSQQLISGPRGSRQVEVLRLGRAGLWYVTPDDRDAGYWDPRQGRWIEGSADPGQVRAGIRVIRQTASPRPVTLPLRLEDS
ncbi:MAG: DUF3450 domain-containing protein [Gammaproteobacteria bacterium]|nr:DUF3450 domain-containing protein [Gammaproteobacteria bacterium]NNF62077.1 DUF3450 domain-containing protein [Gammaproteobacteria bacterium]NNM20461.1 DUF3450 domain-containing protein [Gammaproteobacteria bacterium]